MRKKKQQPETVQAPEQTITLRLSDFQEMLARLIELEIKTAITEELNKVLKR